MLTGLLLLGEYVPLSHSRFDPYENRPRILTQDGHIHFKAAAGKDIIFESSSHSGTIFMNGVDLGRLATMASDSSSRLQQASAASVNELKDSVAALTNRLDEAESTVAMLMGDRETLTDVAGKMRRILGTGTRSISPRTIRITVKKVNRLASQMSRLMDLLNTNECSSNPCRHGGTCLDTYNGFICRCPTGWEGVTCEEDVNECSRFSGTDLGCQNGATCTNTPGSFTCQCPANWHGVHCDQRHDDCTGASHEALCGHGTCVNLARIIPGQPKYRCICDQGWTTGTSSSDPSCTVDVDECSASSWSLSSAVGSRARCSQNPRVDCINLPGSYTCGPCPSGYSGDGFSCSDVDECALNNGGCSLSPRVTCTNTIGSRTCGPCPPGYSGDGVLCTYMGGLCAVNNGGCHPSASCVVSLNAVRSCHCPSVMAGDGLGPMGCSVPAAGSSCASSPCLHGGTCVPRANQSRSGPRFTCMCADGYSGSTCNLYAACSPNPCQNGGTCVALDGVGTFLCSCPPNFEGDHCETQKEACRFTQRGTSGEVIYPPDSATMYASNVNCAWILQTNYSMVINVTFTQFSLENSHDCSFDFLQVYDGPTTVSHPLGPFCGHELPNGGSLVSSKNSLFLWFHSDGSVQHGGFRLTWRAVTAQCGGSLNETSYGAISSPGYPGHYPSRRDCYWHVQVPPGRRIQFHFATLHLEAHPNCSFDYLALYDGTEETPNQLLGRFCNTTTPPPVTASGPVALVHFHSDDLFWDTGFHITYVAMPSVLGCGGLLTSSRGAISSPNSPNHPRKYENNMECDWSIRIHPEDRILITFSAMDLEAHAECRWDYVEIRDGDSESAPLRGRFCGTIVPTESIILGNRAWIRFKSDASFAGTGFTLDYTTACDFVYTDLSGEIRSPYHPDNYPAYRTCNYLVHLPPGRAVRFEFQAFDLEGSSTCDFDYLQVFDGGSVNGTLLGKFCGATLPSTIVSSLNEVLFRFVTDGSIHNRGFRGNYSAVDVTCGGVHRDLSGSISSPEDESLYNQPPINTEYVECNWIIRVPEDHVIRLSFTLLNLFMASSGPDCAGSFLEVTDQYDSVIGRYCGTHTPAAIMSDSNELFIRFRAHFGNLNRTWHRNRRITLLGQGFAADYVAINVTRPVPVPGVDYVNVTSTPYNPNAPRIPCDENFDGHMEGSIRSPREDDNERYSPHIQCDYRVTVPEGHVVQLNFSTFELEWCYRCACDRLEIRDGQDETGPLIGLYCGLAVTMPLIKSSGNSLWMRFKTDHSVHYKGFTVSYVATAGERQGCGGVLNGTEGIITSPDLDRDGLYEGNLNCWWYVLVPEGLIIDYAWERFDLEAAAVEGDTSSCVDYLEVRDGLDSHSPLIEKVCGRTQPPESITSGNHLSLHFHTDGANSGHGFQLNYTTRSRDCGGLISVTPLRQSLSSPNYPAGYPSKIRCRWLLTVENGTFFERSLIQINDLDIDCGRGDYLEFFHDGFDDYNPYRLCGRTIPESLFTLSGIKLSFVSGLQTTDSPMVPTSHKGFNLTISKASCNRTYSDVSGTIVNMNYPQLTSNSPRCVMEIRLSRGQSVSLFFNVFQLNFLIRGLAMDADALLLPGHCDSALSTLAIYEGVGEAKRLNRTYCDSTLPPPFFSSSNELTISVTSHSIARYWLTYMANTQGVGCGGNLTTLNATFASPMYPNPFAENKTCLWYLNGHGFHTWRVIFHSFAFTSSHEACEANYVELYNGDREDLGQRIVRLCGDDEPGEFLSSGANMMMKMVTNGNNSGSGFRVASYITRLPSVQKGIKHSTSGRRSWDPSDEDSLLDD